MMEKKHKSGFVNIVGNPNVGKSTLMNRLVGERISIITSKAQTTRHRIMGIVNTEDMQIVYSDTPGVLRPNYKLQESMLNFSESALDDADVLLYVTDVIETIDKNEEFLQQVQKGDYFQMAANYYYGVGAHSMIFIADYDPDTDTVRWCDSNMKGEKRNGIRYGYLQFDAVKKIDWFVDAFCRKKYGATIYRLRDDIIRVGS